MLTTPDPTSLDALRKLVIDQKKAFLPPEPTDSTLADLHQAIYEYDQLVSQVVFGVIQNFPVNITTEQIRAAQEKVNQAVTQPETAGSAKAALYFNYQKRLDKMVDLAQTIRAQSISGSTGAEPQED